MMDVHRQQEIRRLFVALLVTMVALAQLGSDSASATAHKRPDFGSAEGFRLECELLGGTYSEDGIGNTNCHYPDGTWTQCDANGNDCWVTPPARPIPPAAPLDSDAVTNGEVTTDHGDTSATAPETVGPTVAIAADRDEKPAKAKSKRAKGKKRKK